MQPPTTHSAPSFIPPASRDGNALPSADFPQCGAGDLPNARAPPSCSLEMTNRKEMVMSRRTAVVVALLLVGVVLSGVLISQAGARGSAFGHSHGPMGSGNGMMGGYHGHHGYGPGMMRGHRWSGRATLLIHHRHAHCHAWSFDGGPFRASQTVQLRVGSRLTVIDMDVMPHRLIQLAGQKVSMRNGSMMGMGMMGMTGMMGGYRSGVPGLMPHMGASTTVRFSKPGVYRFRTRAGEDYWPGVTTTGADNVLTLTVTVR